MLSTRIHPAIATGLLLAGALLQGCLVDTSEETSDRHPARVTVNMEMTAPVLLAKSSDLLLSRAEVLMVSSRGDTLRDTVTAHGSRLSTDPATFLDFSAHIPRIVSARYDLPCHRTWTIGVRIFDSADSLRLEGAVKMKNLGSFEYRSAVLPLQPRLLAYGMEFLLPSAIRFPVPGAFVSRHVYFTRLAVTIDGIISRDTSCNGQCGSPDPDAPELSGAARDVFGGSWLGCGPSGILLKNEYVPGGGKKFGLSAYGYVEGDTVGVTPPRLLFRSARDINTEFLNEPGVMTLEWQAVTVAPAIVEEQASEGLTVVLGRVGTGILNITVPGAVML